MNKNGKHRTNNLLAFEDPEFLMRDEMRAQRLALEFAKAEIGLTDWGVKSTIVVFGSSRAVSPGAAARRARTARTPTAAAKAEKLKALARWYDEARAFGRIVSERGGALSTVHGQRENVIATGGGPGIMEAANRGAADAGAPTIGFNIEIPAEQRPNKYITPDLSFQFHYFAVRKMHFAMRANALAVFPGGFGTMDELFEILTLKQTRKTPAMPVILFCREYWQRIINFPALAELGTIDKADIALFQIVDTADEGWQAMVDQGLTTQTPLKEA
jgi:uncharacterized protein (TIGR00730 family)